MLLYPPQIVYTSSNITYGKCEGGCLSYKKDLVGKFFMIKLVGGLA